MIRVQSIKDEIVLTVLIVLTDSQKDKVENKDLQEQIENIAADLKVSYAVEVNGNVAQLALSRSYSPVVYDLMEVTKNLVKVSEKFIESVTALEINSPKANIEKKRVNRAKKINDDVPYKEFKEDSEFIKKVLNELDNKQLNGSRELMHCDIIAKHNIKIGDEVIQVPAPCGTISKQTLRRLLMVYLEYYKEYLC
jgi:hypothetical protein